LAGLLLNLLSGLISGSILPSAGSLMPYKTSVTAFDIMANVWTTQWFPWTVS
jgi:hypothetical protein